ncbi:MAG TPA: hypothetical protein VK803_08000 [Steroidobacteraceae bacterium]|jgi:hypothetical protein|nr:hypothetical protein [Steroidobacteraceae bacterium]
MKAVPLALALLAIAGCATFKNSPSPAELTSADYAPAPTQYEQTIRRYFDEVSKDPSAIQYREISQPEKWWLRDSRGLVNGGDRFLYGWLVRATVNGKNSFGGYVGFKTYGFLFKGEEIVKVVEPE